MKKEQTKRLKNTDEELEGLALPRRGFLQQCALVTGAFLVGTLRMDKPFAQNSGLVEHYCCFLAKPRARCPLRECTSQFFWTCSWTNQVGGSVIIRCVECFDVKISIEDKYPFIQGWTETVSKNIEHLKCSKAVHPAEDDFTVFGPDD